MNILEAKTDTPSDLIPYVNYRFVDFEPESSIDTMMLRFKKTDVKKIETGNTDTIEHLRLDVLTALEELLSQLQR